MSFSYRVVNVPVPCKIVSDGNKVVSDDICLLLLFLVYGRVIDVLLTSVVVVCSLVFFG